MTAARTTPSPTATTLRWLPAVTIGAILLAIAQAGMWGDLSTRTFPGPDPVNGAWVLASVSRNLIEHPTRLFAGNLFYPNETPVVYANALVAPALMVAPLRFWSSNPALLYNAAIGSSLVLTFLGFWLLAVRLWGDHGAGLVPAIAVTYCAHQIHHITQLNLVWISGFPFVIWGALELIERPSAKWAVLTGTATALQAMSCGYYGMTLVLLCVVIGAWGVRSARRPAVIGWTATAALIAATLSWPYLHAFRAAPRMERNIEDSQGMVLRLPRGLFRTQATVWSGILPGRGDSTFAGLGVLLLAAIGLVRGWRRPDRYARLLLLIALVLGLFSLGLRAAPFGWEISLPYAWLWDVAPLMRAGRHPVTFALPIVMATALMAAYGAKVLHLTRGWRLAALVAVVLAEVWAPPTIRVTRKPLPAVFAELKRLPPGPILQLPLEAPIQQWWAIEHGIPVVNGTLPHTPPLFLTLAQWWNREFQLAPPRDMSGMRSLRFMLAQFPVRYLVAYRSTKGSWVRNIEATPSVFEPLGEFDGARLYRVHRRGRGESMKRVVDLRGGIDRVWLRVAAPASGVLVTVQDEILYDGPTRVDGRVEIDVEDHSGVVELVIRATEEGHAIEVLEIDSWGDTPPAPSIVGAS